MSMFYTITIFRKVAFVCHLCTVVLDTCHTPYRTKTYPAVHQVLCGKFSNKAFYMTERGIFCGRKTNSWAANLCSHNTYSMGISVSGTYINAVHLLHCVFSFSIFSFSGTVWYHTTWIPICLEYSCVSLGNLEFQDHLYGRTSSARNGIFWCDR